MSSLIEIHVLGDPPVAVKVADEFMRAAQANGYTVRMGAPHEISTGDGWFAVDYGSGDRAAAEAEIGELINSIDGGTDILSIGGPGPGSYNWALQSPG